MSEWIAREGARIRRELARLRAQAGFAAQVEVPAARGGFALPLRRWLAASPPPAIAAAAVAAAAGLALLAWTFVPA